MKLTAVILENFRRYRQQTVIPIDALTAFIGRNDEGKSTILDVLDIFFDAGTVKIDTDDASKTGDARNVRIGAKFTDLPETLGLDRGARTTLQAEHLLNRNGELEIFKQYNLSGQRAQAPKVFARALHPTANGLADLLQKGNPDLKRLVKEKGVEANCNQSENPSMRQALYAVAGDLALAETEVPLNDADAKDIWEAIKQNLPVYALFRSDRVSSDQDPEVQNPMKLAIQAALANLAGELDGITTKVQQVAETTAQRTIEQLRASYPDLELASVLKPNFEKPKWANVFKLDLESDDQVPLNKRGSGVRRLVLMSFFQAEAARKKEEREANERTGVPVIYAIEEPETSQYPENQERIIRAFRDVAEAGDQVVITTHVPGIAALLPRYSLRFVDTDPGSDHVRVRAGTEEVFSEIAETLGVLPDASERPDVKVAVAVEGVTDIDALVSFAEVLSAANELPDFDQTKVFWTIGGGSTLKAWVERRFLDKLRLPQMYLLDSDRTSANLPLSRELEDLKTEIESRENCRAFVTRKREIENYLHPEAVARVSGGKIAIPEGTDLDYADLSDVLGASISNARSKHGSDLDFRPTDQDGQPFKVRSGDTACKKLITGYLMRQMTLEEIKARGAYTDDATGKSGNEIEEWLEAIRELMT